PGCGMRAARQTGKLARHRRGPPEFRSALAEAGRKGACGEPAPHAIEQAIRRRAGPRVERHRLELKPDLALGILSGRTFLRGAARLQAGTARFPLTGSAP